MWLHGEASKEPPISNSKIIFHNFTQETWTMAACWTRSRKTARIVGTSLPRRLTPRRARPQLQVGTSVLEESSAAPCTIPCRWGRVPGAAEEHFWQRRLLGCSEQSWLLSDKSAEQRSSRRYWWVMTWSSFHDPAISTSSTSKTHPERTSAL